MRARLLSATALVALLAWPATLPAAQTTPPQDYEAAARAIVNDLAARNFEKVTALYDDRMAEALPLNKLTASWDGVIAQVGAFKSISGTEMEESAGTHSVYATCIFERLTLTLRIVFNAKGQFAGFTSVPPGSRTPWKVPDYAKTELFDERPITIHSGHWDLPGSLTIPKGSGPFPAIVLVHGSGPNDMDESFGPNKMFRDLAYGLSSRGIAVLRYTKRSRQYGAKSVDDLSNFTLKDEAIDDARAAVAMLSLMREIEPHHIFVAGHSLGAYVAPRIADGDPQIAGIILMAGNTRPFEDLVVEQVRFEATLNGAITPDGQKQIDAAEKFAREMRNPDLKPGMMVDLFGSKLPASYIFDMRNYHPGAVAASLKIPMLIMQGERDYQVRMADLDGWRKSLAGHTNVTFKTYPALTHFFMAGTGPSTPVEYMKPNHVEADVIEDIATWIGRQGGAPAPG